MIIYKDKNNKVDLFTNSISLLSGTTGPSLLMGTTIPTQTFLHNFFVIV